jgi:group I intron endonuclease|uniref:GIY-YIG domain-containing protein n=1 Tax=viral metagenome TaxID=1070528 RepID=A0A6C0DJ86_9ZZZZ
MGVIYKLTSPSGKSYIGQTKRSIETRIKEHFKCPGYCIALENAIKKYGNKMEYEILLETNDEQLNLYESRMIHVYNTVEPFGYNIRSGGEASTHSEQSCERMRQAKLGDKNHNFGKPRTEEAKLAISAAKSGDKHHFYGKTFTEEHKVKLAISHRKSHLDLPMYLVYVKERPEMWQCSGYAIVNHPTLKNKYFTSKKLSDNEKYDLAIAYLQAV